VEQQLSDPAIYQRRDVQAKSEVDLQSLLRDQTELKEQLEAIEGEWLEVSTELESI
jgi:ATP-binding cassette, subfamily F, member 3